MDRVYSNTAYVTHRDIVNSSSLKYCNMCTHPMASLEIYRCFEPTYTDLTIPIMYFLPYAISTLTGLLLHRSLHLSLSAHSCISSGLSSLLYFSLNLLYPLCAWSAP